LKARKERQGSRIQGVKKKKDKLKQVQALEQSEGRKESCMVNLHRPHHALTLTP